MRADAPGSARGTITWLEEHRGTLAAIVLLLAVVAGLNVGIVGAAIGDSAMADNGWAIMALALIAGMLIRWGYSVGRRSRQTQLEEQLADIYEALSRIEAALERPADDSITQLRRRS
jgi:predicted permease